MVGNGSDHAEEVEGKLEEEDTLVTTLKETTGINISSSRITVWLLVC